MNKQYKDLTLKFADLLQKESFQFMMRHLKNGSETSDIINLVLSSHLSSCFTCMKLIASEHKEHTEKVHKFITNVTNYISTLEPIKNIEVIT